MKLTKEIVQNFTRVVIVMHDRVIKFSGGENGMRDIGGLEHAVYSILSDLEKHQDRPFELSAKAYKMLATRHYFVDGNKRTSHLLAKLLLINKGYRFVPKYADAVQFIIDIAAKEKTLEEIEEWLKSNVIEKKVDLEEYVKDSDEDIKDMKKWKEEHS